MSAHIYAGIAVDITAEGYLTDTGQWTPAIGEAIANEIGVSLGAQHWEAINFVREDYAANGKSPGLRRITTNTNLCMKDLYKLFPKGPGKLVAKIAGTPKPKSCL